MKYYLKLRDWIDVDKIDWEWLSENPNAIDLLEKNMDKINWQSLSLNPNAIDLLEMNFNLSVCFHFICCSFIVS